MKSIFHPLMLCLLFMSFCVSFSNAQNADATMIPVYNEGRNVLSKLEQEDYTVVRIEYDLVFKEFSKNTYRQLFQNKNYSVYCFGDSSRIKDLDIVVYQQKNNEWIEVAKDNSTNAVSSVNIHPDQTGYYKIEIKLFQCVGDYTGGHYGLIIAYN
jgi:hypothetical protein